MEKELERMLYMRRGGRVCGNETEKI